MSIEIGDVVKFKWKKVGGPSFEVVGEKKNGILLLYVITKTEMRLHGAHCSDSHFKKLKEGHEVRNERKYCWANPLTLDVLVNEEE